MPYHKDLAGTDLHENKGAATAADDDVATVTGGATVWKKIGTANLDAAGMLVNTLTLSAIIDDVGTAGTSYITAPYDGTLEWATLVLQAATTSTDTIITFKNSSGVTMDTITIPAGATTGSVHLISFASDNTFVSDGVIMITTDGGSAAAAKAAISFGFVVTY